MRLPSKRLIGICFGKDAAALETMQEHICYTLSQSLGRIFFSDTHLDNILSLEATICLAEIDFF
jgi:hypothetical protein